MCSMGIGMYTIYFCCFVVNVIHGAVSTEVDLNFYLHTDKGPGLAFPSLFRSPISNSLVW